MKKYPKNVLTTSEMVNKYISAGMEITDLPAAQTAIDEIGFYRLRGYAFHLIDPSTKKYNSGTTFDTLLNLYKFDCSLRSILFDMLCRIEVALRSHFCEALLLSQTGSQISVQNGSSKSDPDPLIYLDASIFKDKKKFWSNTSVLSSEIARSNEAFILHNFEEHDGQIPIWAAVEIMSFGTLSKFIKNLKTGKDSAFYYLAKNYTYKTKKSRVVFPSQDMLSSWIHAAVVLRNICAHNSRIYNRSLTTKPQLLATDAQADIPRFSGLYHFLLAMKYLCPSDQEWKDFILAFQGLLQKYKNDVEPARLHLPSDWMSHMQKGVDPDLFS